MTAGARPAQPGLVLANFGRTLLVEAPDGCTHHCAVRRKTGAVVAGDRVDWQATAHGDAVVIDVHPRASLLSRPDRRGRPRPVCANIDQLVVVAAAGAALNTALIDRYTVAAELLDITPLLVINKLDLADNGRSGELQRVDDEYRKLGYRVVHTSARENKGITELRAVLRDRASVFVGESGVGKSSLIQVLHPDTAVRIGPLSEGSGAGRHTTTTTTLFHLPGGGDLIDSPGVREFRLWQVEPEALGPGFREFREFLGRCRYRNCLHNGEPGCAVVTAAEEGLIGRRRIASYREILGSLEA